ncbi:MAG: hypothetical protein IK064_04720, partial [Clostridia bacterium]|nr:hypothetical protein [Clostridia bacterium]
RLTELKRWFPTAAAVHAKLSVPFDGAAVFGSTEELFTPELVMRSALDGTAKRLNDIYRASAGGNAPDWNGLTSFARRSNIASSEHQRLKLRILLGNGIADEPLTPELFKRAYAAYSAADEAERERFRRIEHERWMRFHIMNNWRFADTRDNAARCHPLLLPYDRLTREEQLKDDFAWELLGALAKPAGE